MSERRAKQMRRLVRMANFGDREAMHMVLARITIGKARRISARFLAVDARRAARHELKES